MKFVTHQPPLHLSFKIKCCVDRLRPPSRNGHSFADGLAQSGLHRLARQAPRCRRLPRRSQTPSQGGERSSACLVRSWCATCMPSQIMVCHRDVSSRHVRRNSRHDVATEEARSRNPATLDDHLVRLVAEPRPLGYRDGAMRSSQRHAARFMKNTSTNVESSRSEISCSVAPPDILYIRGLAWVQGSESGVAGSGAGEHQ